MPKTDRAIELTDYERQDFSVCLGCKICASVCTVNDLDLSTNPQEMLQKLFLGKDVAADDPLVRFCTGCYRCTGACPWEIRIPDVVRALRQGTPRNHPLKRPSRIRRHMGKGLRALRAHEGRPVSSERRIHKAHDEMDGIHGHSSAP